MGLLKLRLSMIGTLAVIIGASTLFFTVILSWVGLGLYFLVPFIIIFNIIQWLIAPYMIDAMYGVKEIREGEQPKIYAMVRRVVQKTRQEMPRIMLANIPIPNAFAYSSPIAGKRVAVTTGLLNTLEDEEVEAVLAHELGHLKHRDVQIMMFASVLPAIFYYIGFSMMLSAMWGGGRDRNAGGAMLIGFASLAIYFILSLFVLGLSRLREYYADQFSVRNVDDGSRKLSEALAKIVHYTKRQKMRSDQRPSLTAFKALFISDPDRASQDSLLIGSRGVRSDRELVKAVLSRRLSTMDHITEIFSTHPNIVKRLKALRSIR